MNRAALEIIGQGGLGYSFDSMSPSTKPHRDLKINVPRHNSQRIGPVLTANVENVARDDRMRVDVSQTALEPSSALAQAIVSKSTSVRPYRHCCLLGKCVRLEFSPYDCPCRTRSAMGRRYATVRSILSSFAFSLPIRAL